MVSISPLVGFLLAPVVAAVVLVDAVGRGWPRRELILWPLAAAGVTFGGFLTPSVFAGVLNPAYLRTVKPAPVVTSPVEILVLHLTVGVAFTAGFVLLYALRVRYDRSAGSREGRPNAG